MHLILNDWQLPLTNRSDFEVHLEVDSLNLPSLMPVKVWQSIINFEDTNVNISRDDDSVLVMMAATLVSI